MNSVKINLRNNGLSGEIPSGIGLLTALEIMQLRENLLVSSIPSEVGLLTALTDLNIRDNKMTGDIPSELYGLMNLGSFNIGNTVLERGNAFRGSIPPSVALMTNLSTSHLVSFLVVFVLVRAHQFSSLPLEQRGFYSITSSSMAPFRQ